MVKMLLWWVYALALRAKVQPTFHPHLCDYESGCSCTPHANTCSLACLETGNNHPEIVEDLLVESIIKYSVLAKYRLFLVEFWAAGVSISTTPHVVSNALPVVTKWGKPDYKQAPPWRPPTP